MILIKSYKVFSKEANHQIQGFGLVTGHIWVFSLISSCGPTVDHIRKFNNFQGILQNFFTKAAMFDIRVVISGWQKKLGTLDILK